jgi:hypothetical protein
MTTKVGATDEKESESHPGRRRADESSSDPVKRLASPRRPISEFAGMWADMSKKERDEIDRVYRGLLLGNRRRAERIRRFSK